jgi:hypothetical protein
MRTPLVSAPHPATGSIEPSWADILSPEALAFVARLARADYVD